MLNLDSLEMSKLTNKAIKVGNVATKAEMAQMDPDDVADVVDDAADLHADIEDIQSVMAEPFGANAAMDEDDLFSEFLEAEEDREMHEAGEDIGNVQLPDTSTVNPMPNIPTSQPVVSQPV